VKTLSCTKQMVWKSCTKLPW